MIIKAEIVSQPYSGQYRERIYDVSSPWNSGGWTWVKFTNEDFTEWCGEFRGSPRNVSVSFKYNQVLVLTTDYMFQLDIHSGDIIEYESQPHYRCLTVTPFGDFIVADYYNIEVIQSSIRDSKPVESPIKMDMVEFNGWNNNKLSITCDEFLNWDNHVELELDSETMQITLKT